MAVINFANEGRTGNKMFAFAFSYLLAKALGTKLISMPLPEFPNTNNCVLNQCADTNDQKSCIVKDSDMDFESIVSMCKNKQVHVRGWFERSEFYAPFVKELRELFEAPSVNPIYRKTVFHFRGKDFVEHGKCLPISYHINAWKALGMPSDCVICTDDMHLPEVLAFSAFTGSKIENRSPMEDFDLMLNAKNLVISRSTFSWWAAFLSDARVIQPRVEEQWKFRNHIVPYWTQIDL